MSEIGPIQSGSPMEIVERWLNEFLASSHPDLGRPGKVCPFVGPSIGQGMMRIKQSGAEPTTDEMRVLLENEKDIFLSEQSSTDSSALIYASRIIVMSEFSTEAHAKTMDEIQAFMKVDFMNNGLMIGQFHPYRETPGLHNKDFFPHKCPAFCFAIRHMIQSDHVFVSQSLSGERVRAASDAFLKRFGATLDPETRNKMESL